MRYFAVALCLLCFSSLASASLLKVLLKTQKTPFVFKSSQEVFFESNDIARSNLPKGTYTVTKKKSGFHVSIESLGSHSEFFFQGRQLKIDGGRLFIDKEEVNFPIQLSMKKRGFHVIAELPLERYLQGVVPHEMPASWPREALKAQAVASRSYALWKAKQRRTKEYHLKSNILDQVFKIEAPNAYSKKIKKVLGETKGMILVSGKDEVLKSYFHSHCGGATLRPEQAWGARDLKTESVIDPFCLGKGAKSWKWSVGKKELQQKLSEHFYMENSSILDINLDRSHPMARVKKLRVLFDNGALQTITGEELRRIMGYTHLKSTLFEMKKVGQNYVFQGQGNGHGVGLCQWGARQRAKNGATFQQILAHYYPYAYLRKEDGFIIEPKPQIQ